MTTEQKRNRRAALAIARAMGFIRRGWVQGSEAELKGGTTCSPRDKDAVRWCAVGSLVAATRRRNGHAFNNLTFAAANDALARVSYDTRGMHYVDFNDAGGTTRRDVLKLMRDTVNYLRGRGGKVAA